MQLIKNPGYGTVVCITDIDKIDTYGAAWRPQNKSCTSISDRLS